MMAIGQKYRETGGTLGFGHVGGNAAGRRDSLDRGSAAGRRKHDHVVAAPRSATSLGCIAKRLDRTTAGSNLLTFALREESEVAAIGRPEGVRGILRTQYRLCLKCVQRPQPELTLSVDRRRNSDQAAVGGDGEAVYSAVFRRRNVIAQHA